MLPDTAMFVASAVFVIFAIVCFLVARRAVLWYWRINRAIALLESIDESLKCLPAVRQTRAAAYRAKLSA